MVEEGGREDVLCSEELEGRKNRMEGEEHTGNKRGTIVKTPPTDLVGLLSLLCDQNYQTGANCSITGGG